MKLLAVFTLTELDELTADLHDVESKALLARVEDDPSDLRSFQDQVKSAAMAMGHEVVEWDRSQLAA